METTCCLCVGSKHYLDPPPSPEGELMETSRIKSRHNFFLLNPPPSPEGELMETLELSILSTSITTPRLRLKEN